MHRLVPQFILDRLAGGETHGSLLAAGMFIDISGFSAITDSLMTRGQHGAEVLARVMTSTFEPLIRTVFEYGGFVAALAGDGISCLFPVNGTIQHTVFRALAAAVCVQEQAAEQARHVTEYGEYTITVKVGLAFGEASWNILTSERTPRRLFTFRGAVVDAASAAESHARSGEIVIDQAILSHLRGTIRHEPVNGHIRVVEVAEDLPDPQPAYPPDPTLAPQKKFFPTDLLTETTIGEFRQVVVLFAGFPELEDEARIQHLGSLALDLQERYGGQIELIFGDKGAHLVAFWGAPSAYENDIERALSFALDLRARAGTAVRTGITYRVARAGFIGSSLAEAYTVYGRGANLAARFMITCEPGEIWIDENIARRALMRFHLALEGERRFKGFATPQKVYMLSGHKTEAGPIFTGEFAGRETELGKLHGFVTPLFEGRSPGMLVVWGDPGLGKSRLIAEFLERLDLAQPGSFQAFVCQSDSILRQPLNPFHFWLKRYFGISDEQGDLLNKLCFDRKLDALIDALGDPQLTGEIQRTRSFLGALVGLFWTGSLYDQLDPKGRYENSFLALSTLIQAESRRKPVILFFEDAHQMDEATKAFLPRLLRTIEGSEPCPVAVLASARFEGMGLPLEGFSYQQVSLSQLTRDDLALLAASHLDGPASATLVDLLERRSEGNPFFAEQLIQYLKEEGRLARSEEGWTCAALPEMALPEDVDALLVARLDRLAIKVKRIVQTAAVLGREFEVSLLMRMLHNGLDLAESLAMAEREGIWAPLGEINYIFRHALMRDAAYHMQLLAHRRVLHALAVEAYESAYAGSLIDRSGELAYHAEQAGLNEKALLYLRLAAQKAADAYQNLLSVDYCTRALSLLSQEEETRRFEILCIRESVLGRVGETAGRKRDLLALRALAESLHDPAREIEVLLRRAQFALDTGEYPDACALAGIVLDQGLRVGLHESAITACRILTAACLKQNLHLEAIQHAQKGLELVRAENLRKEESGLLNNLGMIAYEQGHFTDARTYFEESLLAARASGNLTDLAIPLNNLGLIAGTVGDYTTAQRHYEQSLALMRKIGDRFGEGLVLGNLGWIAGMLGDFHRARAYSEQNYRVAREIGEPYAAVYALINLSAFTASLSDHLTARKYAEQARTLASNIGEHSAEAWALTYLGHARLALGQINEAVEAYQSALAIRENLNQAKLAMEPRAGLARALFAQGNTGEAARLLEVLLANLGEEGALDGTDDPLRVYYTCYLILQMTRDPRAVDVLQSAYQALQARAAIIPEQETRERFLSIASNREILSAWERQKPDAAR